MKVDRVDLSVIKSLYLTFLVVMAKMLVLRQTEIQLLKVCLLDFSGQHRTLFQIFQNDSIIAKKTFLSSLLFQIKQQRRFHMMVEK